MRGENEFREPLKNSELMEIGLRLEKLEKPNAKATAESGRWQIRFRKIT